MWVCRLLKPLVQVAYSQFFQNHFSPYFPIQERSALTHVLYNSKGLENVFLCQRIPILTTAGYKTPHPRGRDGAKAMSETQTGHWSFSPQIHSAHSQKGDCFASLPTFHPIYCTSLKGPLWGVKLFWKDVWSCALGGELKINRFLFTDDLMALSIPRLLWGKGLST